MDRRKDTWFHRIDMSGLGYPVSWKGWVCGIIYTASFVTLIFCEGYVSSFYVLPLKILSILVMVACSILM